MAHFPCWEGAEISLQAQTQPGVRTQWTIRRARPRVRLHACRIPAHILFAHGSAVPARYQASRTGRTPSERPHAPRHISYPPRMTRACTLEHARARAPSTSDEDSAVLFKCVLHAPLGALSRALCERTDPTADRLVKTQLCI